jgi:hypothetical protein
MKGFILVSTHTPEKTSSGAGETNCAVSLCLAIKNAARIPGPGIVVAEFSAKIVSAALDPSLSKWVGNVAGEVAARFLKAA